MHHQDLSISGRTFRAQWTTFDSPTGTRVISVPPLLKGHSITVQFMITGEIDTFWVCFGTGEQVRSSPGILATFTRSGGSITHLKPSSHLVGRGAPVHPKLVASFSQDISGVRCFWLVWREGLLFAGCGNVGEGLLMAADTASEEISVALDSKPDKYSRYVTDDVAAIFVGSEKSHFTPSVDSREPRKTQGIMWDVVVRALWRNSPCRYARALTTCDSSLPEASPKDKLIQDKILGRKSVNLMVPYLPPGISLAELAWWLRFAFKPRTGQLASKIYSGEIGHNIDVENVRLLSEKRAVGLQLRVTREVLKSLLCSAHSIKTSDTVINIVQE